MAGGKDYVNDTVLLTRVQAARRGEGSASLTRPRVLPALWGRGRMEMAGNDAQRKAEEEPVDIKFRCRCGALLTAPESSVNETVTCRRCGRVLVVPGVPVAAGIEAETARGVEADDRGRPVADAASGSEPAAGAGAAAGAEKTNVSGMAVASLVLGIVGPFLSVLSIAAGVLAIVFGSIALKAMHRSPRLTGRGMAIAGTILGVLNLVLGLMLILAAVHGSRQEDSLDVVCYQLQEGTLRPADEPPGPTRTAKREDIAAGIPRGLRAQPLNTTEERQHESAYTERRWF